MSLNDEERITIVELEMEKSKFNYELQFILPSNW